MSEPPPAYEVVENANLSSDTKKHATAPEISASAPEHTYATGNFPPSPLQPGVPIYTGNPIVVTTIAFNENPMSMVCPHCHHQIVSRISPKSGLLTWVLCGGLALFGCWCCCCIPFCVDSCQDTEHHCPNCGKLLGTYRRI
ncbi:hypothetical protein KIN20_035657 [Parelaphostrongylus tenuis]|uniref:LITAF domain-containing protein n=1 Tax=Parelaphostrongylus tenuis TaxID=148309 RepID=A0AAD5WKM3_PARTN|nr:hypothetical protein KIN20_035657 [Parelaphostrongylus tenuis]